MSTGLGEIHETRAAQGTQGAQLTEYFERFLPWWKQYIRYRMYAVGFAVLGIATILSVPILGIASLAAAAYYWEMHLLRKTRLESKRSVMIGH